MSVIYLGPVKIAVCIEQMSTSIYQKGVRIIITALKSSKQVNTIGSRPEACHEDKLIPSLPIESQTFKVMTCSLEIPHFLYTLIMELTALTSLCKKINGSKVLLLTFPIPGEPLPRLSPLPFILEALS